MSLTGKVTSCESVCLHVSADVLSPKPQMKDFSAAVGIPLNCIFPVKNYSEEIDLNDDMDALILSALRKMIDFGDDFTDSFTDE